MPRHTGSSRFCTLGCNSRHTSGLLNPGATLGTALLAPPQPPAPLSFSPMEKDASGPNAEAGQPLTFLSPEALQPLIKETLRQLGIQGTEQSGSRSSGPRHSRPTQKILLVKEQQSLMSKDDKDWKVSREISLSLMPFSFSLIDCDP